MPVPAWAGRAVPWQKTLDRPTTGGRGRSGGVGGGGCKEGGQAWTNVLRGVLLQITVQGLRAAIEQASVVCCVKWLDFETLAAHSGARSLLRRAKARFNAGAGLGGASSALAKDS